MSVSTRLKETGPPAADEPTWLTLRKTLDAIAATEGEVRLAISISGGGATGAYQAGVLRALADNIAAIGKRDEEAARKVTPRLVVGTSAGALHAYTWLINHLRLAHPDLEGGNGEHFSSALWRTLGARNDGAAFVVGNGRRFLVSLLTRFTKPPVRRAMPLLAGGTVVAAILGVGYLYRAVPGHLATIIPLLGLVGLGYVVSKRYKRSVFANRFLRATLANAIAEPAEAGSGQERESARDRLLRAADDAREEQAGLRIARAWRESLQDLELIVTATDLTCGRDALFTLVRPDTFKCLASEEWHVYQFDTAFDPEEYRVGSRAAADCGVVGSTDFIRCITASTSIPGVFPSQRVPLRSLAGKQEEHDLVDGGVLNNAPLHIAIDAGATHVLSIELNPITEPATFDPERGGSVEPRLMTNLSRTLEVLHDLATREDIHKAVAWNRRVQRERKRGHGEPEELGDQPVASSTRNAVHEKKVVEIYRLAPIGGRGRVGVIDFDGHYDNAFGGPTTTLGDWLNEGYMQAMGAPLVWPATYCAAPSGGHPEGR